MTKIFENLGLSLIANISSKKKARKMPCNAVLIRWSSHFVEPLLKSWIKGFAIGFRGNFFTPDELISTLPKEIRSALVPLFVENIQLFEKLPRRNFPCWSTAS